MFVLVQHAINNRLTHRFCLENILLSNSRAYFNFISSIGSKHTKEVYKQGLIRFMKFCKLQSAEELLKIDMQRAIIDYVTF